MPNLLWVSDITARAAPLHSSCSWICLLERPPRGLITDAYSRKIVGWALEDSLGAIGPVTALKMAIKENKSRLCTDLIHHSDRGVQYCCREYTALLNHHSISISMTEQGDPYENALAERMNRTVKEEMLQNRCFMDLLQAQEAVRGAILNYNILRPHGTGSPLRL